MDTRSLEVLEYSKVLEKIAAIARNKKTAERIKGLKPYTDSSLINHLQDELEEAVQFNIQYGHCPVSPVDNINDYLSRARIGSVLSSKELLGIGEFLECIDNLISYFSEPPDLEDFPLLNQFYRSLISVNHLADRIEKTIQSDGEVADNASKKLLQIRQDKEKIHDRIGTTLEHIINDPNNEKYLREKLVSVRSGRYVIPVKSNHRNKFPGTIMDRSSTGSTLFIEPMSVLELNNELNELDIEEHKEIHRILSSLTNLVSEYNDELLLDYETLLELDFIFAKAVFALSENANRVKLTDTINLKKARHPLIEKDRVVASDIKVMPETKTLVITGPNTGGKTVTLKTLGLLSAMNQSGLFIPVNDNSELRVFNNIFADIGDEQSIEQNLSTFSSHLTNIVNILENNTDNSLILFDELGAGTDPVEGAALAISILSTLQDSDNLTVATTHYPEIKEYALTEDNVENASMEFDVNSLKPTYRLILGIPGRSNAFEIAKRLGLSEEIIENSRSRMSSSQQRLSESLDKAQEQQFKTQDELRKAEALRKEAEELFNKREAEYEKAKKERKRIIERTKSEAKKLLNVTKQDTDFIYREIQNIQNSADTQVDNKYLESLRLELKEMDEKLESLGETEEKPVKVNANFDDFSIGDRVIIKSLNQEVTVTNIFKREKKIEVSSGSIRMKFKPNELILQSKTKETGKSSYSFKTKQKTTDTKLDLRGKTVSEAEYLLGEFIENAALANVPEVEIIHGFGTGSIRKAVSDYLRKSKYIKSYRLGGPGEGGAGVTKAEFK